MRLWDEIIDRRIEEIVFGQHRPFSYEDFKKFSVDGKQITIPYGTLRNKFSQRKAKGLIVNAYTVGKENYYTVPGEVVEKPKYITDCHMVGPTCHPIFRELKNVQMGPPGLHNIRLRFQSNGIWKSFRDLGYEPNAFNYDIKTSLECWDSIITTIGVHRSNTVSVTIGCTLAPFNADVYGIIRLSNLLNIIREHILHCLGGCSFPELKDPRIPSCYDWIVTSWHFGTDSISKYTGEKFECNWQTAEGILVRLYSKKFGYGRRHVRFDKQESPNKKFADLISKVLFPYGQLV